MIRQSSLVALLVAGLTLPACSGGSATPGTRTAACPGTTTFCLSSCNLGCVTAGSCAVTEIAQNQPIEMQFSQPVNPASVNAATISIKTPNGESPAGRFVVDGQKIRFEPQVSLVGGATTFGFRADQKYILSLPGGAGQSQTLRSSSGDPLSSPVNCSLSVTQGLVDIDGLPPKPRLIAPTNTVGVPADVTIVVEFSELIDIGPFNAGASSPIRYRAKLVTGTSGPCDARTDIPGVPQARVDQARQVTVVTFQPSIALPGGACIEVFVTGGVRDLSGRSAVEEAFVLFTETGTSAPRKITEAFNDDRNMDRTASSGRWAGGEARPGRVGRVGELGSFDPFANLGNPPQNGIATFNTDNTIVPSVFTLRDEGDITVDDGVYEYTDYIIPQDLTVRYVGSKPPQIFVRGQVVIAGKVEVNGQSVDPVFDPRARFQLPFWIAAEGQAGGAGGPGGGAGGQGADGADGLSLQPEFSGRPGEQLGVPATSGYQLSPNLAMTGGTGGIVFPADGDRTSVSFGVSPQTCAMVAAGGSGGSFLVPGQSGTAIETFSTLPPATELQAPTPQAAVIAFMPVPAGSTVADHFLVGGSGGGGGGSSPIKMSASNVVGNPRPWNAGSGGTGGAGAILFRAGGSFTITPTGSIESRGGDGVDFVDPVLGAAVPGPPVPGGGGSGGSVIAQIDNNVFQSGAIDISGGRGSTYDVAAGGVRRSRTSGGDGAPGFVRFESSETLNIGSLGTVVGPAGLTADNVGPLVETDGEAAWRSTWYGTGVVLPPEFLYYELRVREGGVSKLYTDDPARANTTAGPADIRGGVVEVQVQGATVTSDLQPVNGTIGPWRGYVNGDDGRDSINRDADVTGFRFRMLFNTALESDIVVEEFSVFIRG